jgi:hypothetical protein
MSRRTLHSANLPHAGFQSQSHVTTDGQSVSQYFKVWSPLWYLWSDITFFPKVYCQKVSVLSLWGALFDEGRTDPIVNTSFTIILVLIRNPGYVFWFPLHIKYALVWLSLHIIQTNVLNFLQLVVCILLRVLGQVQGFRLNSTLV